MAKVNLALSFDLQRRRFQHSERWIMASELRVWALETGCLDLNLSSAIATWGLLSKRLNLSVASFPRL